MVTYFEFVAVQPDNVIEFHCCKVPAAGTQRAKRGGAGLALGSLLEPDSGFHCIKQGTSSKAHPGLASRKVPPDAASRILRLSQTSPPLAVSLSTSTPSVLRAPCCGLDRKRRGRVALGFDKRCRAAHLGSKRGKAQVESWLIIDGTVQGYGGSSDRREGAKGAGCTLASHALCRHHARSLTNQQPALAARCASEVLPGTRHGPGIC
jgi:hypothetical protein